MSFLGGLSISEGLRVTPGDPKIAPSGGSDLLVINTLPGKLRPFNSLFTYIELKISFFKIILLIKELLPTHYNQNVRFPYSDTEPSDGQNAFVISINRSMIIIEHISNSFINIYF